MKSVPLPMRITRRQGLVWPWMLAATSSRWAQAQTPTVWDSLGAKRRIPDLLAEVVPAGQVAQATRVRLVAPELADNGLVVPVRIEVDSPMSEDDHVVRLHLLSQRNPVVRMVSVELGPLAGWPGLSTRVRLAGTQTLVAVAELNRNRFHYGTADVFVTEAACVDGTSG